MSVWLLVLGYKWSIIQTAALSDESSAGLFLDVKDSIQDHKTYDVISKSDLVV